jgi:hypothetical protein
MSAAGHTAMVDGPLGRIVWRMVDAADYWLMQARLGIVDAVCGPEPETPADEKREADRERASPSPAASSYRPPGQTSWSKALVRHGTDGKLALAEVLGCQPRIFR